MAKASDAKLAAGQGGPLEGIPLGIKDLFGTKGVHTQAASHILDGFKPEYESTVTANLWRDGAVMLGKLNMDEFAMGSSNETSLLRPGDQPVARGGLQRATWCPAARRAARPRRFRAWLCAGGDGDRYRRLDPPAGGVHRHRRHQADLWPLLALGHRGVRVLARPGRADRPHRRGRGDHDDLDVGVRSQGFDQRRSRGAGLCGGRRARGARASPSAFRANTAWTGCPTRSRRSGSRASPG